MKICVGLSGGVDSSVAALLLKRQGYDVFAMFMQNWHDTEGTLHGDCEWEEDKFVAELVARKIGIPFYFVDLSEEYRQRVVDYMFDEYAHGRTPNPDVLCNREIKFDAFLKAAQKLGADVVATGHYCRKEAALDEQGQAIKDENGHPIWRILEGSDPNKDQSYFLCQLTQSQLSKAIFPIGDIAKPEVRRLAKEADLPSAEKKDSQGICFVGKVDLPIFLQQKLKSVEGEVVEVFDKFYEDCELFQKQQSILSRLGLGLGKEQAPSIESLIALSEEELNVLSKALDYSSIVFQTETYRSGKKHVRKTRNKPHPWGKVAGLHEGAQFYTLGQRKGLSIGGHTEPLFVIGNDIEANRVYVGEGYEHKGLFRSCLHIPQGDIHWIREDRKLKQGEAQRFRLRIRYRQPLQNATLIMRDVGLYIVFDQPQRSITPGQFAVWYTEDGEMIGSGVIE